MKRSITLKTSKKRREFLTETSDREIYQAIMDAIEASENIDINGGDNIAILMVFPWTLSQLIEM